MVRRTWRIFLVKDDIASQILVDSHPCQDGATDLADVFRQGMTSQVPGWFPSLSRRDGATDLANIIGQGMALQIPGWFPSLSRQDGETDSANIFGQAMTFASQIPGWFPSVPSTV